MSNTLGKEQYRIELYDKNVDPSQKFTISKIQLYFDDLNIEDVAPEFVEDPSSNKIVKYFTLHGDFSMAADRFFENRFNDQNYEYSFGDAIISTYVNSHKAYRHYIKLTGIRSVTMNPKCINILTINDSVYTPYRMKNRIIALVRGLQKNT